MRQSPSSQAGRFSSAPLTPLPRSGFVQSPGDIVGIRTLNPELFVDSLDEADGATGIEERWLAVYDEPFSACVERLTDLPIPHEGQRVFLVSLSEAIRLVRRRAQGLGLVLPEPGQWGAALEAYLAGIKARCSAKHHLGRRRPNIQARPAYTGLG